MSSLADVATGSKVWRRNVSKVSAFHVYGGVRSSLWWPDNRTAMELDKKAIADLSAVLSATTAMMKMMAMSTTLREGCAIMVFSYCHPMAIVLH